jgi:hypothetical protein
VEAWSFKIWEATGDNEPRVRDVDAAERLRFAQARDIRKLIKRTWAGKKIKEIYVRATVARYELRPGVQHPGQRAREYWLTEAQLLKLIARSETEIADAILDDMIRVYMLMRRGLLGSATPKPSLAQVCASLAEHIIPAAHRAGDVDTLRTAWAGL